MTVTLTPATLAQAPILQNLMQLYVHDFSEFWAGTARGELLADGRFEAYPLDDYWTDPRLTPSLIWSDGALAGFTLVNDHAHSGRPVQSSMAEFFIVRKHRGKGAGRIAAELVFSAHPGSWEVAVARKNTAAAAFWRRTIHGSARASGISEIDVDDERWNGPVLRFEWGVQ